MNFLMAIDAGTTGTKAASMDDAGNLMAQAYREYTCSCPCPNWVEQDVDMLHDCGRTRWQAGAPMISWQDNRTPEEVELIRQELNDDDFYDIVRLPQMDVRSARAMRSQ